MSITESRLTYREISHFHIHRPPTIAVTVASLMDEALLEMEVERKLTKLLTDRGFAITEQPTAEYELVASFGMDDGVERVASYPVTNHGMTTYNTSSHTEYTRA